MFDAFPTVEPAPNARFEPFPVTDQQHAYLVGRTGEFELGNVSTHAYYEYEGELDLDRFTRAWQRIVDRHDMLRAVLLPDSEQQVILADVPPFAPEVVDLRGLGTDEVSARLTEIRDRMSHEVRPADRYPLFGVVVSRLTDERARAHISFDGLTLDYLSWQLLVADLTRFYADPDLKIDPLDLTFRDYVHTQRALKDTESYRRAEEYWRGRVEDLPESPRLPIRTDPATISHPRWTSRAGTLDAEPWRALKALAGRAGLTPTALVLAAFAEVLAVWSEEPRFTVNVPRMNRLALHPQANEILGEFASFSLLAVDHDGSAPFTQRAKAVQRQLWTDLAHQQVSGVQVLRELSRVRGGVHRAAMPVVLTSTLGFDAGPAPLLGGQIERVFAISQTPQVYLDVQVEESPSGAMTYNWDSVDEIFPADLIADAFAAFGALLSRLATDPQSWSATDFALASAGPLSGAERPVPETLVQQLFLDQAEQRPDDVAVITSGGSLTYRDVCSRAWQVAHWLCEHGACAETPVAVVLDKGWEQVVAAYGSLFAGSPYLPVDAALPPARIAALLDAAGVSLVLTRSALYESLVDSVGARQVLCVDDASDLPDTPLDTVQTPSDLAYVLFTSGSTGTPKGAMIEHAGMVNCLRDTIDTFGIGPGDRALAVTALHHDMSTFDVFGVLGAGGAIVIPDAVRARDAEHWADLIAEHGVTVWNSVPAMMEMLLQTGQAPSSLRLAFLGGDWIPLRLAAEVTSSLRLVSVGGPTETTLWNIWYPVEEFDESWRSVPYGAPIANTRYHVLDPWRRARPAGVTGELYCAGPGVARGYLGDPERTSQSFVEHDGERLYRTGDRGRLLPDGVIEFAGREDTQVKIRGQRIELGEIEAALAAVPGVRDAVVTAVPHTDRPGYRALAAHVVGESLDVEEIRRALSARLPAHMVPATVAVLDRFPLTRNGKVDRAALASADAEPVDPVVDGDVSPLEEVIAGVWAEVLEVERVGVTDDFFALGGDSLLATRIVARLREALDTPGLGLLSVLSTVTVRQLAAAMVVDQEQPGRIEQVAELYLEISRMPEAEVAAELMGR
ncbi:non-ribosomal peptide synthetase [Actinokineospora xionganensis]|uniref:Phenyloxazoline synthase MbtB n=1 Tax=Actinokineospora xionganensis TaxID=2684470 RepID=A0ABR7L5P9_9PSEU|nr:non-ribosomal peptide synthetase [Actinokineospora xionganensis]MBC6448015.1 amino acid adenylation domain-containing protein [Actinokineospora xionganensis]